MTEESCPETVRARMTPSLLEKLPDTLTRKQFSSFRGRAKGLLDGGRVAIRLLLESASSQQATRFSQRISRVDTVEPQRARLVEQAAAQRQDAPATHVEPVLAATRVAIDGKREELRTLLEVEIPKTLKGIHAAAAEGDLRENFEYHMLRDRQELQSARAHPRCLGCRYRAADLCQRFRSRATPARAFGRRHGRGRGGPRDHNPYRGMDGHGLGSHF